MDFAIFPHHKYSYNYLARYKPEVTHTFHSSTPTFSTLFSAWTVLKCSQGSADMLPPSSMQIHRIIGWYNGLKITW